MRPRETIAVISFSSIISDSRVLRQISSLSAHYDVITVGYGPNPSSLVRNHLSLSPRHSFASKLLALTLLLFRQYRLFYDFWYFSALVKKYLATYTFKAFVLNDSSSWPLASSLPPHQLIIDAHEYTPGELYGNAVWNYLLSPFKYWTSSYGSLGAHHFCVERHLCNLWSEYSGRQFSLLPNSANYVPSPSTPSTSRSCQPPYRILHHGIAHPSREIELMIHAIALAGQNYQGTFLLVPSVGSSGQYMDYLHSIVASSNSQILKPIPQSELISYGSKFDLAILSVCPTNINNKFSLPNKLYQFIQARLPIVCGPTPSIAAIVRKYGIGVVANDFTSAALADAISSVSYDSLIHMRNNLEIAAKKLSWDLDQHILINAVKSIESEAR